MTPLAFVVVLLAVARAARLVTTDDVGRDLRRRITVRGTSNRENGRPAAWYAILVNCDWCVSLWLALLGAILMKVTGLATTWTWAIWSWPALAMGAGALLWWLGET